MRLIVKPLDSRSAPMEAAAIPLPRPETIETKTRALSIFHSSKSMHGGSCRPETRGITSHCYISLDVFAIIFCSKAGERKGVVAPDGVSSSVLPPTQFIGHGSRLLLRSL